MEPPLLSDPSAAAQLRGSLGALGASVLLPLPVLAATDPAHSADVACLYLGLASAWLVTEFHRTFGAPSSPTVWRARMPAIAIATAVNTAIFIGVGLAAGVVTHFPFPLMAALSAGVGAGTVTGLLRRMPDRPLVAVLVAAMLVGACKLAACVVARLVYGPDYIAQGYVAADWRTAKLMITLFWSFSALLATAMLWAAVSSPSPRPP